MPFFHLLERPKHKAGGVATLWYPEAGFEEGQALADRFMEDLDKMESSSRWSSMNSVWKGHVGLGEFTYVTTRIQLHETKAWADEIMGERREFWGP